MLILAAPGLQAPAHVPLTLPELRAALTEFAAVVVACALAWIAVRIVAARIEAVARRSGGEESGASREQRARTLAQMLHNSGRTIVLVVGVMMSLRAFGLETTPLLGSAAVFGLAISFGAQNLVRDYVTGFFLQFEHQFALGDAVRIGTVEGNVEDVTLRLVYLRAASGALHIIPNGQIAQVTNLSRSWRRAAAAIEVPWQAAETAAKSLDRVAIEFADDAAWKTRFLEAPRVTGIEKFGTGSVTLGLATRVRPSDLDSAGFEMRRRVQLAFERDRVPVVPPPLIITAAP